jgi:hypothetical protein
VAFDEDFEAELSENHEARFEVSMLAQSPDREFTEVNCTLSPLVLKTLNYEPCFSMYCSFLKNNTVVQCKRIEHTYALVCVDLFLTFVASWV